jgi:hypothetical protein
MTMEAESYLTGSVNEMGVLLLRGLKPTGRSVGQSGRVFFTFPPGARAIINAYNLKRDQAAELLGINVDGAR